MDDLESALIKASEYDLSVKDSEIVRPVMIPADPVPFNDMARMFGYAGTVLAQLQRDDVWVVTEAEVRARVMTVCWFLGVQFCRQVGDVIVNYYKDRNVDFRQWVDRVNTFRKAVEAGNVDAVKPPESS